MEQTADLEIEGGRPGVGQTISVRRTWRSRAADGSSRLRAESAGGRRHESAVGDEPSQSLLDLSQLGESPTAAWSTSELTGGGGLTNVAVASRHDCTFCPLIRSDIGYYVDCLNCLALCGANRSLYDFL